MTQNIARHSVGAYKILVFLSFIFVVKVVAKFTRKGVHFE
jgi:hypothetical protein